MRMMYVDNILTYKDWHESFTNEDGRKWRLEEGPDGTCQYVEMIPIASPYDTKSEGPAILAARKLRAQMKKRVSKPEKGYITRLSYTRAVAQYHPGGDVPLYSGSSLQRKKKSCPAWMIRMNAFYWRHAGHERPRQLITWATVGDHYITRERHSFWEVNRRFQATRKTWKFKKYLVGLELKTRQKIYTTLSAIGFRFLPDAPEKIAPLHYFHSKSKNKFQEDAKAFWRANPGRKTFVTLTFIEHIEDGDAVEVLNKFLTVVRKELKGVQYIWVAEHQPENPRHTIHFHIIFNRCLKVGRFNPLWVLQQYNAGLRGHRSIDGSEITMRDFTAAYNDRKVGKLLNPFQIDLAKNINQLSAYLVKYVTKTDESEPFGCSNWHCSRKISRLFKRAVVSRSTFRYLHTFRNNRVDFNTGETWEPTTYVHPFFSMVRVHNGNLILPVLEEMELINRVLMSSNWSPGRLIGDMQISEEEYHKLFEVPENARRQVKYRFRAHAL